jgi:hypothetical protein
MNDTNERSCAARGSGWVAVIAIAFCVAGSVNGEGPPFDSWPEENAEDWHVRRVEERKRRAQAIADAPIRQVEAIRQLCDEIAALRKQVAELRAEVAKMRKLK